MIVIDNARVLRATGIESASVVIDGDSVLSIGPPGDRNGAQVIDAGGAWLGPGLVDLHVHFRDPGQTWKEDIGSGARSAAAGGFTAVVTMPNTIPPIDSGPTAIAAMERADSQKEVHIMVAGALTMGRGGMVMADLDAMYEAGIRIFTDDGDTVSDAGLLRRIMRYLADLPGTVVADHAEDASLSSGGHLHDGSMAALHGVSGSPGVAEDVIVARDLVLARDTGARLHVQHVSTASAVDLIREAKATGVRVTAEVTPHHLALDDDSLDRLDPNFKMYPPLRSPLDRKAVAEALRHGVIDAVATDHAPHSEAEKAVPFEEAPRGVIGLETAAALTCTALGGDQAVFFDRMSTAPARIAGLARHGQSIEPGSPANLVLFDPLRTWSPEVFASKSRNSPFVGRELVGKVMVTLHEGRITYEGGVT